MMVSSLDSALSPSGKAQEFDSWSVGSNPARAALSYPEVKNEKRKKVIRIIQVNNKECNYLLNKGWKWREDIHRTYSGANKKYVTENRKLLRDLAMYRKNQLTKTL